MYLTSDKINNALLCAQEVLAQESIYAGKENFLSISIDAVTEYIAIKKNINITIREVIFEAAHLKGRKESYKSGDVYIDIRSNLSESWKRFVALKELMHIIVDCEADDLTPYGDVILEKLVLEGHIGMLSSAENGDEPPAQSELVAEIAAIQVIYPIMLRAGDIANVVNGTETYGKLALKYEAPTPIIDTALNQGFIDTIQQSLDQFEA